TCPVGSCPQKLRSPEEEEGLPNLTDPTHADTHTHTHTAVRTHTYTHRAVRTPPARWMSGAKCFVHMWVRHSSTQVKGHTHRHTLTHTLTYSHTHTHLS